MAVLWVGLVLATAYTVAAQAPSVGDCEPAEAEAFLDVGDVRAKILNNGGLFWNGGQNVYEVPKGEGIHSIFVTNVLIAGLVDGELRMAGTSYGPFEFWPGPIPADGSAPKDCARFDRIYEIRGDGEAVNGPVAEVTGDIEDWPVHLGAPYVDVGGSSDTYDPEEGDYPALLGDQMLWWVMNDRGNIHHPRDTEPLGIEVRASAFAYDAVGALGRATFYRYRIKNRHDRPLTNVYVGLYNDVDIGAAYDDFVGSDTTSGTAYFYNADDFDDPGSTEGYGDGPPAIGFTVLRRPKSTMDTTSDLCSYPDERENGFSSNISFTGDGGGVQSSPYYSHEFYNYLQGKWKDGVPTTLGGDGRDFSTVRERFVFPGDPVTGSFWSAVNTDNRGSHTFGGDKRLVSGLGPFCLGPGDETEVVFAIVWARGRTNLDSVAKMRVVAAGMQEIADTILEPRRIEPPEPEPVPPHPFLGVGETLWPNPATTHFNARLDMTEERSVRISLIDATGREVKLLSDRIHSIGRETLRLSVADVPPGFYVVRFRIGHAVATRTLIITRARPLGSSGQDP